MRIVALIALLLPAVGFAQPKKIVLIAGPKSHGPVGNGIHDYGWSVKLLKTMLEHSNIRENVNVEIHLNGWPKHPKTLEDADTIMIISDGRDGDAYAEAPHLASPERVRFMDAQMKRSCGFLTFHFSTFGPESYRQQMLEWNGGYFQWEQNGKKQWYSAITTKDAEVKVASPDHPVSHGLRPFTMREEFYYNLRFNDKDERVKPLWTVPALDGREPDGRVVAWACERKDGGRGFGTTCGHFYENWKHEQFRKLILNAIAWTAKVDVPANGVESRFFTHDEITKHLDPPIRVLMFAGNDAHKWHNWEKTTVAIKSALERDPRIKVEVSNDIEDLSRKKLGDYHVIMQNYANWQDPKGLSDASKKAFVDHLSNGGGLVLIHFANGAFHFSLPKAGESDWPEYRKIVRRVWNHNANPPSGHDAFGKFIVEPTKVNHPITAGLKPFEIEDELYFRQDGTEPIEPLITARSRITKQNEPLAWTYSYGKARVFQTLLGHSEKTYDAHEPCEMLRRAVAWCADREVRPLPPPLAGSRLPEKGANPQAGKFGNALNAAFGGAFLPGRKEYRDPPLTAECWAKVSGKSGYHIFLANELKSSATHWELFAEAGNGCLTVYLPGYTPDHVRTKVDVTDNHWHHLRLIFEPTRIRMTVDGKLAADAAIKFNGGKTVEGGFAIGSLVGKEFGCGGLIDDVRIMQGVPDTLDAPMKPVEVTPKTVGLWRFDAIENGKFLDESPLKNHATFEKLAQAIVPHGPSSPDKLDYAPVDKRFKAVLIHRSENDAYCGVKCDSQGQLFVGGREGLWVFEPDGKGGFKPRRELYRFPKDSIIIGIEYRGNDLYVLTSSALYLLPEARVKRDGIVPKRLLWGLPLDLHVSFHCLAWGPEGDLYLNHGDPLLNYGDFNRPDHWGHWTLYTEFNEQTKEWKKTPFTGVGAVLRIKPDGTNLRVVATGLRGPVGLCFDKNWNLFTNDNDHESIPDRYGFVKLLHVTQGIDFGWPRGWMASKSPDRSDLIEPMVPNMGRGVPVGLAYMDEPALGIRHQLLQARWDQRAIRRYPISPRGSSYQAEELPFLDGEHIARPTGLCTGRGGRVFTTIHYLPGNVGSPHCVSDLVMITPNLQEKPFDLMKVDENRLWSELANPSWQRRMEAHQEILRRGGKLLLDAIERLENATDDDVAQFHLIWLAAASKDNRSAKLLIGKTRSPVKEIRLQAIGSLVNTPNTVELSDRMSTFLSDADPRVKLAALAYWEHYGRPVPWPAIEDMARGSDDYLRKTAVRILARQATVKQLQNLLWSQSTEGRLAAVLAIGTRLTEAPASLASNPPATLKLTYTSGNAIFNLQYANEKQPIDLRNLSPIGSFTFADYWRYIRTEESSKRLAEMLLAALSDSSTRVQSQAAYYLSLFNDVVTDAKVAEAREKQIRRRFGNVRSLGKVWLAGPFADDGPEFRKSHPPEQGVIDLSAKNGEVAWNQRSLPFGIEAGAGKSWYLYYQFHSLIRQWVDVTLPSEGQIRFWHNNRLVAPSTKRGSYLLDLQPGSNDVLIRVSSLPKEIFFDSGEAIKPMLPDRLDGAELAKRLRESTGNEKVAAEFLNVDWPSELKKGDIANGRRLFGTLACAKCHAIASEQKGGGAPSLLDGNKRFTVPHVVESMLLPSRQVAEPFRASRITLKSGQDMTALVASETNENIEVLLPDGTRKTIAKNEIEERSITNTSPMPAGLVKTVAELRDLLAYLFSDKPQPP